MVFINFLLQISKFYDKRGEKMEKLYLVEPSLKYSEDIKLLKEELLHASDLNPFAGCGNLNNFDNISDWLNFLEKNKSEETCEKNRAPQHNYLCIRESDEKIVGIISIRHHINNPILNLWGGHIGYIIRPSERGKGYGKIQLGLLLQKIKFLNLDKVLVTCDKNNIASEKIIIFNGGIFEKEIMVENTIIKRYWINIK